MDELYDGDGAFCHVTLDIVFYFFINLLVVLIVVLTVVLSVKTGGTYKNPHSKRLLFGAFWYNLQ